MEAMTLKEALLQLLEEQRPNTYYTYTVETPLPKEILALQIEREVTTSELLSFLHDNIRQVLTVIPIETLTELLTGYTSEMQRLRGGFIVNPPSPYQYDQSVNEPIVLISTYSKTTLSHLQDGSQLYANSISCVELHDSRVEIGGQTNASAFHCPDIKAIDFAKLSTMGTTSAKVSDYVQVIAKDNSRIDASGCAEVRKYDEAEVKISGSVRLFDYGTKAIKAQTPVAYLKQIEGKIVIAASHNIPTNNNNSKTNSTNSTNNTNNTSNQAKPLRMATQHENNVFCRRLGIHPHMLSTIRTDAEQDRHSLDELKEWVCRAVKKAMPGQLNAFKSASKTKELLDNLVPYLDKLIPHLGVHEMAFSFNHEQLAERQVFVNDLIPPAHPLKGKFFVFGNQVIHQPDGTEGHYYNHTVAYLEKATAIMHGHSLAFGNQSYIQCYDQSLCYATASDVDLYDQSIASLHGDSRAYSHDEAILYGYDQTELNGYGQSILVPFDNAKVNGVGATAYATPNQAIPTQHLNLISDSELLQKVQTNGPNKLYYKKEQTYLR